MIFFIQILVHSFFMRKGYIFYNQLFPQRHFFLQKGPNFHPKRYIFSKPYAMSKIFSRKGQVFSKKADFALIDRFFKLKTVHLIFAKCVFQECYLALTRIFLNSSLFKVAELKPIKNLSNVYYKSVISRQRRNF